MSWLAKLKSFHQRYFSKHKDERCLYRWIHQHRCRVLMEVGISDIQRTLRLLQAAQTAQSDSPLVYTGIDAFDTREPQLPPLPLREVHRTLSSTRAKIRLLPGASLLAVPRIANELDTVDLLLVSNIATNFEESDAWYYIPRMLHNQTVVVRESANRETGESHFTMIPHREVLDKAGQVARRRRRAA